MATLTVTLQHAQANLEKMIELIEAGTYTAILLTEDGMSRNSRLKTKTQGQTVIGKIVPKATFETADSGNNTERHVTPQLSLEVVNGLYKIAKNVNDANAELDVGAKATYTKGGTTAATGTITTVAGSLIVDGETFTISDGVNTVVFEFDSNAAVTPGRTAVTFTGAMTATQVRDAIISAVNGVTTGLLVTASIGGASQVNLTNDGTLASGNVAITDTVANAGFSATGMSGAGTIVYQARDSGTGGNAITVAVVNTGSLSVSEVGKAVTINVNGGTTTLAQVVAALASGSTLITASATGVSSVPVATQTAQNLAGGASGSAAGSKFDVYYLRRTTDNTSNTTRAVIVSKSCADAIGL